MDLRKTVVCVLTLILALTSAAVFAADVITDKTMKITIGYAPSGMLETSVMKEKKFYKKYLPNVDVEWFYGLYSPILVNNWIAGKLEISYLGNMPAIMLQGKQKNTKWVGVAVAPKGDVGAIFVPKDSPINSIKDLNGKTVATGVGSSHHRLLEEVMKQEGIKFEIVSQTPEVGIGNLEAGKIDAVCYWPPYIEQIKQKNIGKLLPPGNFKKYEPYVNAIWSLVVSESFAKENPDIVKGLVKADQDLHKFMKENPDEAAKIVFKELEEKIPMDVLKASLASYSYTDAIGKEQIEIMQRDIDFLTEKGLLKEPFKAADWADPSFSH